MLCHLQAYTRLLLLHPSLLGSCLLLFDSLLEEQSKRLSAQETATKSCTLDLASLSAALAHVQAADLARGKQQACYGWRFMSL